MLVQAANFGEFVIPPALLLFVFRFELFLEDHALFVWLSGDFQQFHPHNERLNF